MKRGTRYKHDKTGTQEVLGAASAVEPSREVPVVGQPNLPFDDDMLPMSTSQNDNVETGDFSDTREPEHAAAVANFEAMPEEQGRELFVMPAADSAPVHTLGTRLRAAREAKGMDLEQAAARLRLPQRLLAALEADDYSRIEHGVYLRGYLTSYARLLGVADLDIARRVEVPQEVPPPLVATGKISHSRYLYQRYSVPAVYVLLTGLIVGPSVWLATHGGLERNLTRLATLDAPTDSTTATVPGKDPATPTMQAIKPAIGSEVPSAEAAADVASIPPVEEPAAAMQDLKPKQSDQPLMASLAPFTSMASAPLAEKASEPTVVAGGVHRLHLKLSEASWVEILGEDGRKLEFGLLPAGAERDYAGNTAMSVRLGNATGAVVVLDGRNFDLAPYRRSNVAYFRAFGPKGDIAPVEN